YKKIFELRKSLLKNKSKISLQEYGAGSKVTNKNIRSVSYMTRISSIPNKNGLLLSKIIKYYNIKSVIELGTSIGISSLFIANANKEVYLDTIEAEKNKINLAKENFKTLNLNNITFHKGIFFDKLPEVLKSKETVDMIFFDGDHNGQRTYEYFELCLKKIHNNSIFIFDDIHWSSDMEEAWKRIKQHNKVKVSIDIFRMGLVFFNNELQKQDYIIRY
ncbi:MAG: class I SAM-dependent methyltransferase, partial [Bacteroidota bacterium]|nr:class I SAM-dependent methyltransferase [Bacteroidota bacterium]